MTDLLTTKPVAGAARARSERRRWAAPVAAVVVTSVAALVVALTATGGAPRPAPRGLPDAGMVSGWAAPVLRVLLDVAAVGVVGSLLAAAFLLPVRERVLDASDRRALRAAAVWAGLWAAASVCLFVVSTSQNLGRPLGDLLRSPGMLGYGLELPEGRALVALALVSLTVALNATTPTTRVGAQALLALAVAAMFPLLLTGHAATSSDHYWATQTQLLHVLGAVFWVGGLLGLVLLRGHEDLPVAARRFSSVALVAFVALGVSGTAAALMRLGAAPENLLSAYGTLVLVKAAALVVLGAAGWWHRRRTLARLAAGRPRAFLRLAMVELLVMAGAVGAAVALSRTTLPPGATAAAGAAHGGFAATVRSLPPIDLGTLLTLWRPEAVVVTVLALAAGGYLRGVHHLRSMGTAWSRWRTVAMMSGLLLTLVLLCSGVAAYASAMLSVQSAQVLTLAITTPMLISAGRPVLLARSCNGQPTGELHTGWLRTVADPVNGLATLLAVMTLLYATPCSASRFVTRAPSSWVGVAALLGGLLFFWPLLGLDWVPTRRAARDRFLLAVFAVVLSSVLLAVLVRSGSAFEQTWFEGLNLIWCDQGSDMRWAGVIAAAHIGLLLAVATWLGVRAYTDRTRSQPRR